MSKFVMLKTLPLILFWASPSISQEIIPLESGSLQAAYFIADEKATRVSVRLILPFGEMDTPYAEGMAHYVEHLAWLNAFGKGSQDFDRHANASTNLFSINYRFSVNVSQLKSNTKTLANALQPITLTEKFMREERNIVAQEYDLRVTENVWYEHRREVDYALFDTHPLTRSVIGKRDDIVTFSLTDAYKFHHKTHIASSAVLVISGDITQEIAQNAVNFAFDGENTQAPIAPRAFDFPTALRNIKHVALPKSDAETLEYQKLVHLDTPVEYHRLRHQKMLLRRIFHSTYMGGFARPLRFENFIARHFYTNIHILDEDDLQFSFGASPDINVSLTGLLAAFENQLVKTAEQGIPAETFAKVKAQYLAALKNTENPAALAHANALYDIAQRQRPIGFAENLRLAKSITKTEIDTLLGHLAGQGRVVIRLINDSSGETN